MPTLDKDDVLNAMRGRGLEFYETYTPLKKQGSEWRGPCPLHGGNGPNFAVNAESGLWHCFTGCQNTGGDALAFLQRKDGLTFPEALDALAQWIGTPARQNGHRSSKSMNGHKAGNGHMPRKIAKTYDYTDEVGTLLFQAVRYDPKDFIQRVPTSAPGTWTYALNGTRRVLYHLPEVLAAKEQGRPVYLCEGEKDADALRALGLCATSNPMGAGKWEEAYTETLTDCAVVLLPDNDDGGRAHVAKVAPALHGRAKRLRVVELPDLPDKGDVSDWLAAGGTKEALLEMVKAAPDWAPSPAAPAEASAPAPNAPVAKPVPPPPRKPFSQRVISLQDVPAPPLELPYLFGPYLNLGAAHWLTGQTGIGKSTLLYNLLPALAEGRDLWGIPSIPQRILYLDMESGDVGRSLKAQRLFADRADRAGLANLLFVREAVRLPEELADVLAYVQAEGISLVVFDTARRCFTVKDENDNAEVYNRVVPTLDALKAAGVATLTMGHPPKNGLGGGARGAGAQEDAGDVNLTLTMHRGEVSDADGVIALRVTKNRLLGLGVPPLYLRRVGDDQFEQIGDTEAGPGETVTQRMKCRAVILEHLQADDAGRAKHGDLLKAAQEAGFSKATFDRTLREMKGEDVTSATGGWYQLTDPFADNSAA